MFYTWILMIFIILSIINMIFFHSKEKYRKVNIVCYLISLIFSTLFIIIINIDYNKSIINEFALDDERLNFYLDMQNDINVRYIIATLILTFISFIFTIRKFNIRYIIIYDLILGLQLISHVYLFFFGCIIITKGVIDMSALSIFLMWQYLNISLLPLAIAKYRKIKN